MHFAFLHGCLCNKKNIPRNLLPVLGGCAHWRGVGIRILPGGPGVFRYTRLHQDIPMAIASLYAATVAYLLGWRYIHAGNRPDAKATTWSAFYPVSYI